MMAVSQSFEATPPLIYKVILLGDYNVGKTTIFEQVQRQMPTSATAIKYSEPVVQGDNTAPLSLTESTRSVVEQLELTLFTSRSGKPLPLKVNVCM